MTRPSLILILPLFLAVAVACTGDSAGPEHVLTTLDISAPTTALLPETTTQLTVLAWDQFGVQIHGEWAHRATYVSSAPAIVEVASAGLVKGVAPGKAEITATLTLGAVTRTASLTATVLGEPPASAVTVIAQDGKWSPTTVDVKAGGTVTWIAPPGMTINTVWLNVWETNREKLDFINGQATHTFPTPGMFYYGDGFGLMWNESGGRVHVH